MMYPFYFRENYDYFSHKDDQELMSEVIQNEIGDPISVADDVDKGDQY